ncbi:hypothetical protein CN220_29800 [Sinorhizobium meliloti]|nr:hypothetical protein CN220_29800 [Sinorhizobium meliloti]RVO61917.1 hypothetical protein CN087_28885 [Sinorhizobium meliloti]
MLPSFSCARHRIRQRRDCGAGESFQPKDLVWLDSCDEHRNEGGGARALQHLRLGTGSSTSAHP